MRVGSELTDRTEPVLYLSIITHNCVTCRLGPIGFNEAVSGKLQDIYCSIGAKIGRCLQVPWKIP
jgi:hypothetical protein